MGQKANSIFDDLDISMEGFTSTNDEAMIGFSKRVVAAAAKLAVQLEQNQSRSVSSVEENFRGRAQSDNDAASVAKETYNQILELIDNLSEDNPEALVHLQPMMKEFPKLVADRIRTASYEARTNKDREVDEPLNKKIIHIQYVTLRDAYKKWVAMVKSFNLIPPDLQWAIKDIPAKGGNYDNANNSTKVAPSVNYEYVITLDDGTVAKYYSIYSFARRLSNEFNVTLEIHNRMDLHEAIAAYHEAEEWDNVEIIQMQG